VPEQKLLVVRTMSFNTTMKIKHTKRRKRELFKSEDSTELEGITTTKDSDNITDD